MQKVKYAATFVALPFTGELIPPPGDFKWQLKETHVIENGEYENQSQGAPNFRDGKNDYFINTNHSKTHSLQCVWFSIIEQKEEAPGWE